MTYSPRHRHRHSQCTVTTAVRQQFNIRLRHDFRRRKVHINGNCYGLISSKAVLERWTQGHAPNISMHCTESQPSICFRTEARYKYLSSEQAEYGLFASFFIYLFLTLFLWTKDLFQCDSVGTCTHRVPQAIWITALNIASCRLSPRQ
jgi:hypothetical protein